MKNWNLDPKQTKKRLLMEKVEVNLKKNMYLV